MGKRMTVKLEIFLCRVASWMFASACGHPLRGSSFLHVTLPQCKCLPVVNHVKPLPDTKLTY